MTKRIEIIRSGVFSGPQADPVPVGTIMEVRDDFQGWPGKWRETSRQSQDDADQQPQDDADDEAEEVRARYEVVFGKKPHGNATVKSMQAAINKEMGGE